MEYNSRHYQEIRCGISSYYKKMKNNDTQLMIKLNIKTFNFYDDRK